MLLKNIYIDRLDSFSFDEMLRALQSVGQETHRLDFKRPQVGRPKLAQLACAFANADGGIIAIGFADPANAGVELAAQVVDISDGAKVALAAAINARVYPPLPLELFGYASGSQSFLVIRIDRSDTAPHEYIFPDSDRNLPVRRDTATGSLRLAEIDALRQRGLGMTNESPLGQKPYPHIPLMMNNPNADNGFTVHMRPDPFARERRVFDADDDFAISNIVDLSRGPGEGLFVNLTGHTYIDGIHFYAGGAPHWSEPGATSVITKFAPEQITIDADGEIALRFLQNPNNTLFQYLAALGVGYLLMQRVFHYLGLTPFGRVNFVFHLDERRLNHKPILPNYYRDDFDVDLVTQSFTDAMLPTTVRMYRETEINVTRKDAGETLERFAAQHVRDLRAQWQ